MKKIVLIIALVAFCFIGCASSPQANTSVQARPDDHPLYGVWEAINSNYSFSSNGTTFTILGDLRARGTVGDGILITDGSRIFTYAVIGSALFIGGIASEDIIFSLRHRSLR